MSPRYKERGTPAVEILYQEMYKMNWVKAKKLHLSPPPGSPGKLYGTDYSGKISTHQGDIRCLNGNVRTSTNSYSHIGLSQGRGIVDSASHHESGGSGKS